ncbi:DNA repair protein RadA [Flavobacteriaceae bacterium]|jgi:DNA repair protein RadA/Sms|nr:DNA repair protein RadA [Flavobacteriaceae bacterium]
MAKSKTSFFCQSCGTQYAKWVGQCNSCKAWNTVVEELIQTNTTVLWGSKNQVAAAHPVRVEDITLSAEQRLDSLDEEFNRVLGGGIVPGSLVLIGGEPGVGKSTLMLQIALALPYKVLYVSGEESLKQLKMRAERIHAQSSQCYILTETHTESILKQAETMAPDLVVIDSIQTLHTTSIESSPGSVSQIRACTAELIQYAKHTHTPVLLIGHITKDGSIAGPKILEHMVDTVLQFEGDRHGVYRILRALKNRFGSTAELGIYEMAGYGLRQVANPSEILMTQSTEALSGTAIAATVEGLRPLLVEIQALVSSAVYGTPQRSTTGYNAKRLHMLLAVLEKRAGFKLASKDVFLNITGGITLEDPAMDLAVIAAILSSNLDIPIAPGICFAAEVGLSGEIRPVQRIDQRISEAARLGFTSIVVSKHATMGTQQKIKTIAVGKVEEVFRYLFGKNNE